MVARRHAPRRNGGGGCLSSAALDISCHYLSLDLQPCPRKGVSGILHTNTHTQSPQVSGRLSGSREGHFFLFRGWGCGSDALLTTTLGPEMQTMRSQIPSGQGLGFGSKSCSASQWLCGLDMLAGRLSLGCLTCGMGCGPCPIKECTVYRGLGK